MCQTSMKAGQDHSEFWTMNGAEGVGVFKCKLLRVKLADGSIWKPEADKPLTFEADLERQ